MIPLPYYRTGDAPLHVGDCSLLLQELQEGSAGPVSANPGDAGNGNSGSAIPGQEG